ncbi:152_t:CDS:2 [Acaulospora colombiana]|uniref:152_t:CDS:1 n=1 Tax=Acaulospora colombiana TaxID=27376 RepID=A0ACA9QBP0_9GLOM|nr:152_t:CDS:2 [Acaulospora colombiana]
MESPEIAWPFLWNGGTFTSAQVSYSAPTRAQAQVRTISEKRTELTSKVLLSNLYLYLCKVWSVAFL